MKEEKDYKKCDSLDTHTCACLVVFDSLRPHGLKPNRLLCPWNFPWKNNGEGSSYSRGILLTQGSNPCLLHLLHWQADSLPPCHLWHEYMSMWIYNHIYSVDLSHKRQQSNMSKRDGGGMGGRSKRKGTYLCTRPIRFTVTQKLTQYSKAVIFQYKRMGGRSKRKGTYLCTRPIRFIVMLKLTQHGKAVIFQYNIK